VGSGLGGGSSDAACLLKSLNNYFGLRLNLSDLKALALELGSDCPFFIEYIPVLASGRGEISNPIGPILDNYYLILLNPGLEINTGEAYANCKPEVPSTSLSQIYRLPVEEWKAFMMNDFEEYAFKKHPVIGEIKDELYSSGAIFSSMSGSGSSVYGIFTEKPQIPQKLKDFVIFEGMM
jgi:4-diphosphocytidyl-2-C-methyl-D-erythritol kinase